MSGGSDVTTSVAEHDVTTPLAPDDEALNAGPNEAIGLPQREQQDLADIMTAFTQVTTRLQGAHQTLQAEVRRLNHELRETNEQLRRSRQLAALGQMAAGIAHEIRNPLASIRLYASMLSEDLTDRPDSNRLALQIARAVRDLDAVVGDVLNFAREMKIRPAPTSVSALLHQAVEACQGLLHDSSVQICRDLDAERNLPDLDVDAALLNQAMVNLMRNAIEAMSGDGTLTLSATGPTLAEPDTADVTADDEAIAGQAPFERQWITIVVDDTGPGIAPEIVERIFNPFFTTRHTGTGLGLAIVHRIVDAHGGEIAVDRNADGGASISLRLPIATARPDEAAIFTTHAGQ